MRRTRALVVLVTLILSLTVPPAVAREGGAPAANPDAASAAGPAAAPAEVLTQVIGDPVAVPPSNVIEFYEARATCPPGQTPTGGGPKVSP
ncbi:hypothetical protein [Streptomyces sp. CB01881]|uniref:hypothetical protein n=1 Tax=Streptomyces sp. CB01881 TaxID=2078691 RepID=UPI000CDBA6C4|nr:hypothetical protein [Streptomyces sp. CB01881]AUY48066.1 hypothetical protein C2142_02760 [Streptomyces sp. CB01881]TYC76550.1 hypothetical protein EH183_02770 [Streptomyces sp. CB01881]